MGECLLATRIKAAEYTMGRPFVEAQSSGILEQVSAHIAPEWI
jgi:hypothetical protein